MVAVEWMWADAGIIGPSVARMNRLRWSRSKSIEETLVELNRHQNTCCSRPVEVKLRGRRSTVRRTFPSLSDAVAELQTIEGTCECDEEDNLLNELPPQVLLRPALIKTRWMWWSEGGSSLLGKKNPAYWSNWQGVQEILAQLRLHVGTQYEQRAVKLQIETKSDGGAPAVVDMIAASMSEAIENLEQIAARGCAEESHVSEESALLGSAEQIYLEEIAAMPAILAPTGVSFRHQNSEPFESTLQSQRSKSLEPNVMVTPDDVTESSRTRRRAKTLGEKTGSQEDVTEDAPTRRRARTLGENVGDAAGKRRSLSQEVVEKVQERNSVDYTGENLERRILACELFTKSTLDLHKTNLQRLRPAECVAPSLCRRSSSRARRGSM